MELPDGLPDAMVPAVPSPLPVQHRAAALPQAPRGWDALDAVRPDAVLAARPALAAAPYAERLAVLVRAVLVLAAAALLEVALALCRPDAVPSAA